MYSSAVLDRVRNPLRVGTLPDESDVGVGQGGDLDRGAMARIWVRVRGPRIVEARFNVFGCSAAIAAAALVAERLDGAAIEDAARMDGEDIALALALPAERLHVAEVAVAAAREAVAHAIGKTGRT